MRILRLFLLAPGLLVPALAAAQDPNYAKELANPLAALISMPIQAIDDEDFGPEDWDLRRQFTLLFPK